MFGSGENARENKGGKCYFPPFGSAEKTEGRENKRENKSLGPTKIHLPKSGRKQKREKAPILKWCLYPLRLSIWVKVSQVVVALRHSSKFHAVDFATHKISCRWLHHPQNFTSPPTKSHRSPSPSTKSCFLFLWCPLRALVTGNAYGTMGRRKVDLNGFCFCLFLFFYTCKCVQQFLFINIIFFI